MAARKVLVAEPDPELGDSLVAQLEAHGLEVRRAGDGFQAHRFVEAESFDGYILSIKMNGMSGLQVAATIKVVNGQAKPPVYLLAEAPDRETVRRVAHIGVGRLLVKPIVAQELATKMAEHLKPAPSSAKVGYDVRIMNVFLAAVKDTLDFYLAKELTVGKAGIKTSERAIGYLSALISFTGEAVKGSMAMSFQKGFLGHLAKKIFPDVKAELGDDMLADLAGEICNQVCGAVKTKLAKHGLKVMIGLPKVVLGSDHRLIHIVKNPVIWLPIQYENEKCSVEFCMDKSDDPIDESQAEEAAKGGDVLLF